jgi:hypothetical protein
VCEDGRHLSYFFSPVLFSFLLQSPAITPQLMKLM